MPSVGDIYDRSIEHDTAYKVYAVGLTSGTIYLQLLVDDMPTTSKLEWQGNRWNALVEREGLTLREATTT